MAIQDINKDQLRELIKSKKDNLEIIDVREPEEYDIIHIKDSKLIPMNELAGRLDEIGWNKEVVFICRSGARSQIMAQLVSAQGKDVKNLQSGIYECFSDSKGENLIIDENNIDKYF